MSDFIDVVSSDKQLVINDAGDQSHNKLSSDQVKDAEMKDAYLYSQNDLDGANKLEEVFMRLFNAAYFFINQAKAEILVGIFYEKVPSLSEMVEESNPGMTEVFEPKHQKSQAEPNDFLSEDDFHSCFMEFGLLPKNGVNDETIFEINLDFE